MFRYTLRTTYLFAFICFLEVVPAIADPPPRDPLYWPQFRGPTGQGIAPSSADVPVTFDESTNIKWKVEIPGSGWSSPVIARNQIWLTTATENGRSLRAIRIDRSHGRISKNIEIFRRGEPEHVHSQNSHATPTPLIDGPYVYVHFGRNGTACLTSEGNVVWQNQELTYKTPHGSASSPVLHGNLLIICCDGEDKQFVAALNRQTGKIVWKRDRQHLEDAQRKSLAEKNEDRKGLPFIAFSTPLVVRVGDADLLISTPADHVVANRVDNGEEVWWMPYNCFSLVARPLFANGLVYVIGGLQDGHYAIYAIRPDRKGKIVSTDIVWSRTQSVPQVPSPLIVGNRLLLLKDNGIATCVDALTGQQLWQKRLGGNFRASPIAIGDKVFAISQKGIVHVFRLDSPFTHLAKNQLNGIFLASPGVAENSLCVRSEKHLYCIEAK